MFEGFGGGATMGPRKAKPVENRLPCTLEELYKGTTKKMKISRNIADVSGYVQTLEASKVAFCIAMR